ncbi:hypothetical protein D3C81_2062770 [compost metagenome]
MDGRIVPPSRAPAIAQLAAAARIMPTPTLPTELRFLQLLDEANSQATAHDFKVAFHTRR